ncbi:TIGR04222 domain-containing membrane protein [Streptomyces sp. NPDC091371]|uniref:TIGR04222 domain-containing membrane protein n=1 Tax=Streptomyces sp. NPDC091371 TaxID=3155303 RepID=UPI0034441621
MARRRPAPPPGRAAARPSEPPAVRDIDAYEASYLCGGRTAVAETAMAALYLAGRLSAVTGTDRVTVEPSGEDGAGHALQAAVVACTADAASRAALELRDDTAYHPAVGRLVERLIADGLVVAAGSKNPMNRQYPTEAGVAALRRLSEQPPPADPDEAKVLEVALYGLTRLPPGAVLPVAGAGPKPKPSGRHWPGTGGMGGVSPESPARPHRGRDKYDTSCGGGI